MTTRALPLLTLALLLLVATPARAFDANDTFRKGAVVLSIEGGGGSQHNIEGQDFQSGFEFWNAGVRVGWVPFGTSGGGPFYGAFEVGVEPYYQHYMEPKPADFGGLGLALRYHFLGLGRLVPYAELLGAAGGTDLRSREIDSSFTFLVHGGVGLELFVTDRVALYAGFRMQHVSNGNTSSPNRGFESRTGVGGVSFVFP